MDSLTAAPPVAEQLVTADPTPPTQPDMDAIQRVVRDALEEHETRRRIELDTRDERLKNAIRDEIKDELRPLQEALEQRVTAEEARKIAGEEISAVQKKLESLETSVAQGFESFRTMFDGITEGMLIIKGLPERISNLDGQVSAYAKLQVNQDEQRTAAVLRAEKKADDAMNATEAMQREMSTRFSVIHNDLYGTPGGIPGAIAQTHKNGETLAEFRPVWEHLKTFLDREEGDRQTQRDTLASLVAWQRSQIAKQEKRDALLASLRMNALKAVSNKWLWGGILAVAAGGLYLLGVQPDAIAPFLDLFR